MGIDCLPRFMGLKTAKLLAKNFQLYIKAQKKSQEDSIIRDIVIAESTLDFKFPWQTVFSVSIF